MKEAKHTPGPWATHPIGCARYVVPAIHTSRPLGGSTNPAHDLEFYAQPVCEVDLSVRRRSQYESRANANLIAAAPDLLAALRMALPYIEEGAIGFGDPDREIAALAAMTAAIAKAEGRS